MAITSFYWTETELKRNDICWYLICFSLSLICTRFPTVGLNFLVIYSANIARKNNFKKTIRRLSIVTLELNLGRIVPCSYWHCLGQHKALGLLAESHQSNKILYSVTSSSFFFCDRGNKIKISITEGKTPIIVGNKTD